MEKTLVKLGLSVILSATITSNNTATCQEITKQVVKQTQQPMLENIGYDRHFNIDNSVAEKEWEEEEKAKRYLGEFTVTAYCGCKIFNGKWTGSPCKNGEYPQQGVTVACDPNVIPLNTYIEIEGYGVRKCQDTGSKIINKRLDLYFDSHQEALNFGVKRIKVYLAKE